MVQLTEVSMLGVRSVVMAFRHPDSPLRFVLLPTIHFGRPDYYRRIASRLGRCQVVVAEQYDGPSSTGLAYVTALRLTRRGRGGPLVHQDIDYARLGVPTIWPDGGGVLAGRHNRLPLLGWLDLLFLVPWLTLTMLVGGRDWLLRRNMEISDDTEARVRTALLQRLMIDERDDLLRAAIQRLHRERGHEEIAVGIAFGAGHMPAVVRTLVDDLGYRPERGGEWLLAIDF